MDDMAAADDMADDIVRYEAREGLVAIVRLESAARVKRRVDVGLSSIKGGARFSGGRD